MMLVLPVAGSPTTMTCGARGENIRGRETVDPEAHPVTVPVIVSFAHLQHDILSRHLIKL
jgi:hypothetical protein